MLLTMGATSKAPAPPFVAHAQSLAPSPLPLKSPVAVVETRTVRSASPVVKPASQPVVANLGGLGFIMPGSNCVACVKAMTGRSQNGNAGTWKASHSTPQVGDIMIWRPGQQGAGSAGHVGVVRGIKNGKVQIAHCNWGGGQTEFYSTGLFW